MFTCLWVLSCPFGGPALVASHLAAGRFTSEVLCGRVGVSEIGHVWVSCRHESKDNGGFPSFCGDFPRRNCIFRQQGFQGTVQSCW